eukprot:TRINITY_DN33988_c0_g1_i1.p1 TRINITY_DN33988_c0_g1~~TRINITY_DN33988_c0_g1_i1.p1  ORF type:complete len:200 (+),score=37.51 TRINITY_DN33988_c0_g1_i1:95-694(+)
MAFNRCVWNTIFYVTVEYVLSLRYEYQEAKQGQQQYVSCDWTPDDGDGYVCVCTKQDGTTVLRGEEACVPLAEPDLMTSEFSDAAKEYWSCVQDIQVESMTAAVKEKVLNQAWHFIDSVGKAAASTRDAKAKETQAEIEKWDGINMFGGSILLYGGFAFEEQEHRRAFANAVRKSCMKQGKVLQREVMKAYETHAPKTP